MESTRNPHDSGPPNPPGTGESQFLKDSRELGKHMDTNPGAASTSPGDITKLMSRARSGDEVAKTELFTKVYKTLRQMAHSKLFNNRGGDITNSAALVSEVYLRLVDRTTFGWNDSQHLFRTASKAMKDIIVDHARKRMALKRGGDKITVSLDRDIPLDDRLEEILHVNQVLDQLQKVDPKLAEIVEYKYFVGLPEEEIAALMEVSTRTVRREWKKAKMWLAIAMGASNPDSKKKPHAEGDDSKNKKDGSDS